MLGLVGSVLDGLGVGGGLPPGQDGPSWGLSKQFVAGHIRRTWADAWQPGVGVVWAL